MQLRLKLYRERAGLTQKEMATVLGVPLRTYQNYEHNIRVPSLEVLYEVASTCGASLDELVGYMPKANMTSDKHPITANDYDAPHDIARSIRRIRLKNGMTQAEFGDIAGVSSMAVSQWENGRSVPRMGAIRAIASHFRIPLSDVVDGASDSTGKRIEKARALAGMTQRHLAKMAGTTQQNISRYENGTRDPKAKTLAKMAQALGVSISYLLGITDDEQADVAATWDDVLKIEEKNLLGLFRQCDQGWKHYVFQAARMAAFETKSGRNYMEPLEEEELKDA